MISAEIYQGEDLELILSDTDPLIDITLNTFKGGIGKGDDVYYPFVFTNQTDRTIQAIIDSSITKDIPQGTYSGVIFRVQGSSQFVPTAIVIRVLKTPPEGIPNATN